MCEDCTNARNEIRNDLIGLLQNDPDNRLLQAVEKNLPNAIEQINVRIDEALESGRVEGPRPDDDEIEEAVRDCLIAAVLGTGAASLAGHTPGYTDEGKRPLSVILGTWAGCCMANEMQSEFEDEQNLIRHLLGMGDN